MSVYKENVLIGVTHNEDGTPRIQLPRTSRVGLGWGPGPALRVYIHPKEKETPWYVVEGYMEGISMKERSHKFPTRAAAESFYWSMYPKVAERKYPVRAKFITFSKPHFEDNERHVADFDAIEAHGPTPTSIQIMFSSADAMRINYQNWSQTDLRCRGDGVNAMRLVAMYDSKAKVPAEHADEWEKAKAGGERNFPILNGCYVRRCPFGQKNSKGVRECKPGLSMNFKTVNHFLMGVTATFHTTGFESIRRTFSSFTEIRDAWEKATGKDITGLSVFLTVRPYMTHPEGQKPAQQLAVHLELPLKTQKSIVSQLRALALEMSDEAGETRQISAVPDADITDVEEDPEGDDIPVSAAAIASEFYETADDEDAEVTPPVSPIAAASNAKVDALAAALDAAKKAPAVKAPAPKAAAPAPPASPPPTPGPVAVPTPSKVTEVPVAALPWSTRSQMNGLIIPLKEKVGDLEFYRILRGGGIDTMGEAKHDDPRMVKVYNSLMEVAAKVAEDDRPF